MKDETNHQSAQFQAVEKLQILRDKYTPGSRQYEIAEKAIDLSLNASRAGDKYLLRNAYRDARRAIDRDAQKYIYVSIDAANDEASEKRLPDWYTDSMSDCASPEAILMAQELSQQVLRSNLGERDTVGKVLQGLSEGETAKETAEVLSIGPSRVAQYREKIRHCLRDYLYEEAA